MRYYKSLIALATLTFTTTFATGGIAAAELSERVAFDIQAQGLDTALLKFSEQAGVQVSAPASSVAGKQSAGIRGEHIVEQALKALLQGSGLTYRQINSRTVAIGRGSEAAVVAGTDGYLRLAQAEPESPGAGRGERESWWRRIRLAQADEGKDSESSSTPSKGRERVELEEILVTGTHIRGAQIASPVVTITQEEMRLAGHNSLGEAMRALPQNFSGGQNPGVGLAQNLGGNLANQNVTGASSLNLRGLGPDATLTLLNGTRLAYDGISQSVDVSVIPVAAIERVEVLLDGASAIYGSDAVAGVANIILKRDYEGAELSARYGEATDGGHEQQQYTALAGIRWGSGGLLVTGDYSYNDSVRAGQRDYLTLLSNKNLTIYPQHTQQSALLSGHQRIGALAEFNLDAFYTERSQETQVQTSVPTFSIGGVDSSIWGAAPSLDFALPGDWSVRLHGTVSRNEAESSSAGISFATGARTSGSVASYINEMKTAGVETEGPLFALPGGQARLSLGGGYRSNTFDRNITNLLTGVVAGAVEGEARSRYVYGEVDLPLVSEDQEVPLARQVSLNAALRHEEYDSFDAATTPKIGAVWAVVPGFELKATWGKSYKVPTLFQQYTSPILTLDPGTTYGRPAGSQVLRLAGGSADLKPEEAEIITAGFVARPEFLPGLTLEVGYFDIDYIDRAAIPVDVPAQALSNPVYAEFVTANPTTVQQDAAFAELGLPVGTFTVNNAGVPYDPARVVALIDTRYRNTSIQRVTGVDVSVRYTMGLFGGDLSLSGNGDWITDATRKLTELAPPLPAAGVNFWPPKFKGRLGVGWTRQGFTLSANVYHIDGIVDRNVTPNVKRDSMTTLDLIADIQWDSDLVGDVGFNLAVTNVFNEAPPFLQPPATPTVFLSYDSNNYSALGRLVSATITKRF